MSKANWNIFDKCFNCGDTFDLDDLTLIDGEKYCKKCSKDKKKEKNLTPITVTKKRKSSQKKSQDIDEDEDFSGFDDEHDFTPSKSNSEVENLKNEINFIKSVIQSNASLISSENMVNSEVEKKMMNVEKIIISLTFRRLIEIIKKRFHWEKYDLKDFFNKKKNTGFMKIIEETKPLIADPLEERKMERWAKIFNRYARDGIPSNSEEIEAIMELIISLIRMNQ